MIRAAVTIALSLALVGASDAHALTLQQVGGSTFDQPTYVTSDPGDASRLFVTEQDGIIQLVENGTATVFVDFSSKVSCCGERGLLSVALDPNFDATGRLYVDYTGEEHPGEIHVAELVAEPDRKTADPTTLRTLLTIPHSDAANHNGGQLQFGPDGDLYISTGDGGGGNDEFHNAQNLESGLGKILRIRPDPTGPFYTVAGNPFATSSFPKNTIWSYGLRNPYRFSFDRLTGDMVIADVGQGKSEEIDFAPSPFSGTVGAAGVDYGWNCREGFLVGPGVPDPQCATPPAAGFADPVFDYPHTPDPDSGGESRCAIIGGYVVRDLSLGALYGHYLYADLCSGAIRSLQLPASSTGSATDDCWTGLSVSHPVSFGEDAARRVYVVAEGGAVYRIAGLPSPTCPTPSPPSPTTEPEPLHRHTSFVGIEPQRRRVERGKVALLTVWVSPCDKRKGQPVVLLRDGHANGSKFLSRACTARFLPRVRRTTTFTATVPEDSEYLPAESRHLKIRIQHRHRHRR